MTGRRCDRSEEALDRLLEYYRDTAAAADDHVRPLSGQATSERFDGLAALAWLDAERPTLVAAVTLAAASGRSPIAVSLAVRLAGFLYQRRHFDDMITTGQTAADSAHHAGDQHGEGSALNTLGSALREARRFDEAIAAHQQSLAICQELDDRYGEAAVLNSLGVALREARRFDEAIAAYQQSRAICQELDDRYGEAAAQRGLGLVLEQSGRAGRMKSMLRVLTRKGRRSTANGRLRHTVSFRRAAWSNALQNPCTKTMYRAGVRYRF